MESRVDHNFSSDIQDYFEYILAKYAENTVNPSI